MAKAQIHTIVIYPRLQVDTTCAVFILRNFGEQKFPGVSEAKIDFWNKVKGGKSPEEWEAEGVLLVDMGGGKFDHHNDKARTDRECASTLVAKYLGIDQDPALKRILVFAKRDDLDGRGIVSKDVIDRAFGLPAIVMNMARDYPDHPEFVVEVMVRIFMAQYHEEYRRKVLMPREWQALRREGKAEIFEVESEGIMVKVVMVTSDSKTLVGFLRVVKEVQADVVVQRATTGHVNILTRRQKPKINLLQLAMVIRRCEAIKKGLDTKAMERGKLSQPGLMDEVTEWYYDTAANTLQNGGADPRGVTPTKLSDKEMRIILQKSLKYAFKKNEIEYV